LACALCAELNRDDELKARFRREGGHGLLLTISVHDGRNLGGPKMQVSEKKEEIKRSPPKFGGGPLQTFLPSG